MTAKVMENHATNASLLPIDVLSQILSQVNFPDLGRARSVCKDWLAAVTDETLRKHYHDVKSKPPILHQLILKFQGQKLVPAIMKLIDAGIGINEKQRDTTPLHLAAQFGLTEVVRNLFAHGALPKELDKDGCNALLRALKSAQGYSLATVTALVEGGCELEYYHYHNSYVMEEMRYHALLCAADRGQRKDRSLDCSIVEYLARRTEVRSTDKNQNTILHLLCAFPSNDLPHDEQEDTEIVKLMEFLVARGAPVDSVNAHGLTPLANCFKHGFSRQKAQFLLQRGVNLERCIRMVGLTSVDGIKFLHEEMQLPLDRRFVMSVMENLSFCLRENMPEPVEYLDSAGADFNVLGNHGATPLTSICFIDPYQFSGRFYNKRTAIIKRMWDDDLILKFAKKFVSLGIDVNAKTMDDEMTALDFAYYMCAQRSNDLSEVSYDLMDYLESVGGKCKKDLICSKIDYLTTPYLTRRILKHDCTIWNDCFFRRLDTTETEDFLRISLPLLMMLGGTGQVEWDKPPDFSPNNPDPIAQDYKNPQTLREAVDAAILNSHLPDDAKQHAMEQLRRVRENPGYAEEYLATVELLDVRTVVSRQVG